MAFFISKTMGPLNIATGVAETAAKSSPLGAILGIALPGIGQGIAQMFGRKRRKKQEDAAMMQMEELANLFRGDVAGIDEQLNQSYLENSDVQEALRQLQEMGVLQNEQVQNQAAVTGATDEAQIAAMGKTKNANADAFAKIMSGANQYRNMLFGQKGFAQRGLAGVTGTQYQAGQQNRQNFNQSLQNIFGNLQSSIGAGFESGAFKIGGK